MPRQTLAVADITDLDLNLAKNDKALAAAVEIHALSSDDRQQRLKTLHHKISEGAASLFEERVLTALLEPQGAERILAIQRHLPRIEKAFEKRSGTQRVATTSNQAETPTPDSFTAPDSQPQAAASQPYQSELLDFISSQKPPTPPPNSAMGKTHRSVRVDADKNTPFGWSRRDQSVVVALIVLIGVAMGYRIVANRTSQTPLLTFDQQARQQDASSVQSAIPPQAQTEFDDAMQGLRSGNFEQAQTQLLAFIAQYSQSPQAEAGYMALADTSRQRQNDPDQALVYYQKLLDDFPNSLNAGLVQLKMGFAYEDLEDFVSAEAMYRLVLDQHGSQSRIGQLAAQRLNALTP